MKQYKDGSDKTINGIIKDLAKQEFHQVSDLWDEFYSVLSTYDLNPELVTRANGDKSYIEYDFYIKEKYSRKKKTYKKFRNDVSRFRKKKSK